MTDEETEPGSSAVAKRHQSEAAVLVRRMREGRDDWKPRRFPRLYEGALAERLVREALRIYRLKLSEDSSKIVAAKKELAEILQTLGRPAEGAPRSPALPIP